MMSKLGTKLFIVYILLFLFNSFFNVAASRDYMMRLFFFFLGLKTKEFIEAIFGDTTSLFDVFLMGDYLSFLPTITELCFNKSYSLTD